MRELQKNTQLNNKIKFICTETAQRIPSGIKYTPTLLIDNGGKYNIIAGNNLFMWLKSENANMMKKIHMQQNIIQQHQQQYPQQPQQPQRQQSQYPHPQRQQSQYPHSQRQQPQYPHPQRQQQYPQSQRPPYLQSQQQTSQNINGNQGNQGNQINPDNLDPYTKDSLSCNWSSLDNVGQLSSGGANFATITGSSISDLGFPDISSAADMRESNANVKKDQGQIERMINERNNDPYIGKTPTRIGGGGGNSFDGNDRIGQMSSGNKISQDAMNMSMNNMMNQRNQINIPAPNNMGMNNGGNMNGQNQGQPTVDFSDENWSKMMRQNK